MQPSHLLSQRDQDPGLPVSWLVHWRQRKFFTWSMQASVRGCFLSSRSFTKFLNCCSSSVYFCEVHLFSNEAKEERKKAKGIGIHTHTHTHTQKSQFISNTNSNMRLALPQHSSTLPAVSLLLRWKASRTKSSLQNAYPKQNEENSSQF